MKILVVGLGSIGRRHIKNIKSINDSVAIGVLRQHSKSKNLGDVSNLVSEVFYDESQAVSWRPEIAVIANPAPFHIKTALSFANTGAHLFIEKPLSTSLEGIDQLEKLCDQRKLVVQVGYVLRFSPVVNELKKAIDTGVIGKILSIQAHVGRHLSGWRLGGDYRNQVSACKELGGGVILELSHEIDYVRWLAGEVCEVSAVAGKISDLQMDVEDSADINVRLVDGGAAHIHMDMIDRAPNRGCRIIGSQGTLVWESQDSAHQVRVWTEPYKQWQVIYETNDFDTNLMHKEQWRHFFQCINLGSKPLASLEDGKKTLQIALAALVSSEKKLVVTI